MFRDRNSKQVLVSGAVRPWHVVFILAVAYPTGHIAAYKLTAGYELDPRMSALPMTEDAIVGIILILFTFIVPELRRVLPALFSKSFVRPKAADLACAVLVMSCWGFGLYHVGFVYPVLLERPDWFELLGLTTEAAAFELKYVALVLTAVVFAPVAEELMFRGFLMNLWIARWGAWAGVIASSVVFALFHFELAIFAAPLGIVFALVYLRYDSLWPGIALHATYNFFAFNWALGSLVNVKASETVLDPGSWALEFLLAILFFPAAWQFWRRFRPRPS